MAAASNPYVTSLILQLTEKIVNPIIVVMFSFALAAFIWGVYRYIANSDNEEARTKGAQQILWGIIGMFFMIAAFTLIRVLAQTFGFDKDPGARNAIETILK